MALSFLTLNDQVGIADDCGVPLTQYEAPEDFYDGNLAQARDFLVWWSNHFDIELPQDAMEVKYWDGRTMAVLYNDDDCVANLTFVFEG